MKKKTINRVLSMIVVLTLLVGILPVNAWAVDHVHDGSCGYAAPADCSHTVCSTEVCGYVAEVTGIPCAHEIGTHEGCGYVAEVPGTPCAHTLGNHDAACGYHAGSACSMVGWTCDHATCGYAPAVICEVQDCTHESCGQTEGTPCPYANWTCSHADCGYVEAVACGHGENHNADCGYSAGIPGTPCGHTTHDSTCGYVEAVTGTACGHSHDDACGYSEGSLCNYEVAPIDDTGHTHSWSNTWSTNLTDHWHECTADGCTFIPNEADISKGSYGTHNYVNYKCTVCGYDCPHSLGLDYDADNHWQRCSVEGCGYTTAIQSHDQAGEGGACSVCYYDPNNLYHEHSWTQEWTNNTTHHWHVCNGTGGADCDPADSDPEDSGYDEHSYSNDTDTLCDTCGYTRTIEHTHTVTYTDGVDNEIIFEDQPHTDLLYGSATPAFEGSLTREGFTFAGWSPAVAETVTGDATYIAQWTEDAPDTPDPLTVSVSPTYLIGGGTITITTSKSVDQVTADDMQDLIEITTNDKINWTATIPDYISGRTYFIATDENGSVKSAEVNFSSTFWINPTSETLTGGGIVTLVTAVPVSSVTCNASGINVQGSGDGWTAALPNSNATYTFTATLGNRTATCTVSVVKGNTITFHGNSGGGSMEPIVVKEGEQVALPACSFTAPDGYTFAYWSTKANGTGTQYESGKILKPSTDITLYAIWKAAYVTDNSTNKTTTDTTYKPITIPVTGDDTIQVSVTVTEGTDSTTVRLQNLTTQQIASLDGGEQIRIDIPSTVADTPRVTVRIPSTVVTQLSERTDADLQIATGVAEVNIASDALAENAGELVMEARRTEDGISTKVSIGGVSMLDTSVMLFVSLNNLPEDGKLVVGTLQPGADDLNFLPLTETTEPSTRMAMVTEDKIVYMEADIIGPDGGRYIQHEKLLIHGKEYYVFGSGDGGSLSLYDKEGNIYSYDGRKARQEIGQNVGTEYPENEFININGAVYQVHSVRRDTDGNGTLILYLDGKPAGMCQFNQFEEMDSINIYNEDYAPDKVRERQQNSNQLGTVTTGETPIDGLESGKTYNVSVIGSNDIHLEGAENASGTVTQTFDIPADLVGRTDVTFVAVHNTNPHATALAAAKYRMEEARAVYWDYHGDSDEERQRLYEAANRASMEWSIVQEHYDAWEKEHAAATGTGNELGIVTISEDGKTLTATYTVSSFSPFTIYAFVEADEPEIKTITTLNIPDESTPQAPAPTAEDAPGSPIFRWITLMSLTAIGLLAVVIVVRKRSRR